MLLCKNVFMDWNCFSCEPCDALASCLFHYISDGIQIHKKAYSSTMVPISSPGGLSMVRSWTQQHHHQQIPQGHLRGRRNRIKS